MRVVFLPTLVMEKWEEIFREKIVRCQNSLDLIEPYTNTKRIMLHYEKYCIEIFKYEVRYLIIKESRVKGFCFI